MNVRPAAVAGRFYPDDPSELNRVLDALLQTATSHATSPHTGQTIAGKPRALIVPHAGYPFSGVVAAAAFATLRPNDYQRVLLLGPAHRVSLRGLALPDVDAFATPLGPVPICTSACQRLLTLPMVTVRADAHAFEHALEVQLPFLQRQLGRFELIPVVVGDCPPESVAAVIRVLHDDDTLLVISTDLSHFHSEPEAHRLDADTIRHILAGDAALAPEQACGAVPLNGFLQYCDRELANLQLLAKETSADHGGPRSRVVGYASFRWH